MQNNQNLFTYRQAILTTIGILGIIFISLFIFKTEPHIPLLACILMVSFVGITKRVAWKELEDGMVKGIQSGVQPIILLALIGLLIGAWMFSGTIPTVIVYALSVINPTYLLITALFSCMVISSLVGSSFTTVSTIGVALMGVGIATGLPLEWVAGAVICGACFGDKMSPMSDTTNFASGVSSVPLFTHIRHMTKTTVPAIIITAIIFLMLGFSTPINEASLLVMSEMVAVINQHVAVSMWTLLSPLLVIVLAVRKFPVIPAFTIGIISAGITGILVQDASIGQFLTTLQNGTTFTVENEQVSNILNRGGLQSMMWSISLIMIAFALGGLLEKLQIITTLLTGLFERIQSRGQLILSTVASSLGVNLLTGEQYLSILIPGQTFKPLYEKMAIDRKYLSRSLEDSGTLINPLVPWGVSGAFFAQTLGVSVIDYLPFAFFLYISPLFTILFGFRAKG
ncbi:Na+/H+ antiporter NhaC [Metabacillus herbersteinensis]|uniref:Na+/H+ antiporter NhaC n=1 Tax=Metabacillus herbersteinensis TaxID=283816 RepID=A0ABV6GEM6_9BACI